MFSIALLKKLEARLLCLWMYIFVSHNNVIFRWCDIILTYQEDESQREGEEERKEGGGGCKERGVKTIKLFQVEALCFQ